MSDDFVPADGAPSQRLLDQHDLVIDALGGSLLLFPFDLSRGGLQILESGCADGKDILSSKRSFGNRRQVTGCSNLAGCPQTHQQTDT